MRRLKHFCVTEDLTEQELEAILDDDRARAVVNQLFQQSGSGEGHLDEASSEDEDYEDGEDEGDDYEDDDPEEGNEEDEEEDDIRRRTFAFFGFGEPTVRKQLAKHPKLSECQREQLVHPAAQMLNLSSAAVNGKDCLSAVHTLCDTPSCIHACSTLTQHAVSAFATPHSPHASFWDSVCLPALLQVSSTHADPSVNLHVLSRLPHSFNWSDYMYHQYDNVSFCEKNRLHGEPMQRQLLKKLKIYWSETIFPKDSILGANCTLPDRAATMRI